MTPSREPAHLKRSGHPIADTRRRQLPGQQSTVEGKLSGNSEVAVRALHALAGADMDVLERLYSREVVFHMQLPGRSQGYAGLRDRALLINSALYGVSISVKVVVDEHDTVVTRW